MSDKERGGDTAFFFIVRMCSILFGRDFERASSRLDDKSIRGYALHFKCLYERNFIMRIFLKRGLSALCLILLHIGESVRIFYNALNPLLYV
jgi:hypothetical protein